MNATTKKFLWFYLGIINNGSKKLIVSIRLRKINALRDALDKIDDLKNVSII